MSETVTGIPVPAAQFAQQIGALVSTTPQFASQVAKSIPNGTTGAPGLVAPDGVSLTALSNGTIQLSDASSGTVKATGATTARTLAARAADVVNVKDFGAKGDGTTDDTSALQAALNHAASYGVTAYLPAGTYSISSLLSVTASGPFAIRGAGISSVCINQTGTAGALAITAPNASLSDLTIGTSNASNTGVGLQITNGQPVLDRISVGRTITGTTAFATQIQLVGCGETTLDAAYVNGGSASGLGLVIDGTSANLSYNHKISNTFFWNLDTALSIGSLASSGQAASYVQGVLVSNSAFVANNKGISWISSATNLTADMLMVANCHINSNTVNIETNNVWHFNVTGGFMYPNGSGTNITIAGLASTNLSGVHFGGGASALGVEVNSANATSGAGFLTVTGCQYNVNGGPALLLASGVNNCVVVGNGFFGAGITNNGSNNTILGNYGSTAIGGNISGGLSVTGGMGVFGGNLNVNGSANYVSLAGSAAGNGCEISTAGSDAAIGLTIAPKGGANVYVEGGIQLAGGSVLTLGNGYVAGAPTPTGYIEISDSSGTIRKIPCA